MTARAMGLFKSKKMQSLPILFRQHMCIPLFPCTIKVNAECDAELTELSQ